MTDIVCKCGASRLEDIQCAVCGEYFKAGWIPVSERLPEKLQWCLVSEVGTTWPDDENTTSIAQYVDDEYWRNEYGYENEFVTYWMPLPSPPQEAE